MFISQDLLSSALRAASIIFTRALWVLIQPQTLVGDARDALHLGTARPLALHTRNSSGSLVLGLQQRPGTGGAPGRPVPRSAVPSIPAVPRGSRPCAVPAPRPWPVLPVCADGKHRVPSLPGQPAAQRQIVLPWGAHYKCLSKLAINSKCNIWVCR